MPTRLHRRWSARESLLALALLALSGGSPALAQATAGSVFGTIRDEQMASVGGARISLVNIETDQARVTTSGAGGEYRFLGLAPGPYRLRIERPGFLARSIPDIVVHVGHDLRIDATLKVGGFTGSVTVDAGQAVGTATTLTRIIKRAEIDHLPVQDRGYLNLALLAPGVLENNTNPGSSTPIATAGQTGRNNTFLLDGLSLDFTALGAVIGMVPIDAIGEFGVLTNGFGAELGEASGAIVNVVSRSGGNRLAGRAHYYHRDDALDARPADADLAATGAATPSFEQKTPGGFAGGPIMRDHAFFFASAEGSLTDTQHVVTSSVLHVFRPGAPVILPTPDHRWQMLDRGDINTRSDSLTFRYWLSQESMDNRFGQSDLALGAPERAGPAFERSQGAAFVDTRVLGTTGLNDVRAQVSTWRFLLDTNCPRCASEQRPSIKLGKNPSYPNEQSERRWQLLDTFTWSSGSTSWAHGHTVKAGGDVSLLDTHWDLLPNRDGAFIFATDEPFAAADPSTYPVQYTRTTGVPTLTLAHQAYALFVQDTWRPAAPITIYAGLRWDGTAFEHSPFDSGNLAPRVGAAFAPGDARTVLRASYGRYFDQIPLVVVQQAEQAASAVRVVIVNPGYPDPLGPTPSGGTIELSVKRSTTRLAASLHTPFTEQGTVGMARQLGRLGLFSADVVVARGQQLLVTHDMNYPNLSDPLRRRPDAAFAQVLEVQSTGHSWYRGLQLQLGNRASRRCAYSVAYTWSSGQRDTEDWDFVPQDQRNYAADRSPSTSDVRHQFVADVDLELALGVRFALVTRARSGLPYTITTGLDDNGDGNFNDRPPGVGRNSARGAPFRQVDLRLSKRFRTGRYAEEVIAEAFNLTNHRNWTGYVGDESSVLFGKPTGAYIARQVQLGVRFDF